MKPPLQILLPVSLQESMQETPGYPDGFFHALSFCKASWLSITAGKIIVQYVEGTDYSIGVWTFELEQTLGCFIKAESGSVALIQSIKGNDVKLGTGNNEIYLPAAMCTMLYVPAGEHACHISAGNCFIIWVRPPVSFLEGMGREVSSIDQLVHYYRQGNKQILILPHYPLASDCWLRLKRIDTATMKQGIPDLLLRSYIIDVLHEYGKAAKNKPDADLLYTSTKQKALALKAYILVHYYDPEMPNLKKLAKQFFAEVRTITTAFKQITGKTIPQFIVDVRLNSARQLTDETKLPVKEIAFRCGFNDVSHFIRSFKKRYGSTPGVTRRKASN